MERPLTTMQGQSDVLRPEPSYGNGNFRTDRLIVIAI